MVFDYFRNYLGRMVFVKENLTPPTSYMIGFSRLRPNSDGTGIEEPTSGAGYKRVDAGSMKVSSDGLVMTNAKQIDCGIAEYGWGMLRWCVLFDQNGHPLVAGKLTKPVEIFAGDSLKIKAGDIKFYFGEAAITE